MRPCANPSPTPTRDRDCDGITDSVDNCADLPNIDQMDLDADKIGDACDPCAWASDPAMDDDGDALANAQDDCPADADVMQTDSDGDTIGDACDPSPAADALACFADFADLTKAEVIWHLSGAWTAAASRLIHDIGDPTYAWGAAPLLPEGAAFAIETPISANVDVMPFEAGVGLGAANMPPSLRCVVRKDAAGNETVSILDGAVVLGEQPVATFSPALEWFYLHGTQLTCTVTPYIGNAVTVTATATALPPRPFTIATIADGINAVFLSVSVYRLGG